MKQLSKIEGKTKTFRDKNVDFIVRDIANLKTEVEAAGGGEYAFEDEMTLTDFQISALGGSPIAVFDNPFIDKGLDYKITMKYTRNGATGNYGGVNLNGLTLRTDQSYLTIGENTINLINEAFIADPTDGTIVLYGNSSSLSAGYEFVTPYPLGASLLLTTGNFQNPVPVGDTLNCTLYIKIEYNLI
jgi:hypothetical protein